MDRLKAFTVILFGFIFCLSGASMATDNSIVFHYDFNRSNSIVGSNVKDLSSGGNDGVIVGDVHLADIEQGKAAYFDGSTGYIEIPSLSSWDMKRSVTFSAVIKFLDDGRINAQNSTHDMIFYKDDYFLLGVWVLGGQRLFYFNTNDGKSWSPGYISFDRVVPNIWYQIDVRITLLDKTQGKYMGEYFVNGSKLGETSFINKFDKPNNNPVCIGTGFGGGCWLLHGYVASISMYNRALTDREIVSSVMANKHVQDHPKAHLEANIIFSPRSGIGTINVNGTYIGNLKSAKCKYVLNNIDAAGNRKTISEGIIGSFVDGKSKKDFSTAKLLPGKYEILVSCVTSEKQTYAVNIPWEKPDVKVWRDARAGVSDKVIPPWTPLKSAHENDKLIVSCWGRTYRFAGSGLAEDIVTRDGHILSNPIEISAVVNNRSVNWISKPSKVTSSTPAKIVFKGNAIASGVRLDTASYMEFDGMVLSKFTLTADKTAKIGKCSINIPVNSAHAKYLSYLYPSTGPYTDSYRGSVDKAPKSMVFPYYMWIGDEDRGFAWFSERDMSKLLADPSRAVEILQNGNETVIRINLLDKAVTLNRPLTFTVGFQATPMKPLPKKWRSFMQNKVALVWTSKEMNKYFGYPEVLNPDYYNAEVKKVHDDGKLFMPYTILQMLSASSPEYKYFGDEWCSGGRESTASDVVSFVPPSPIYAVCPAAHDWIDAETYKIKKLVETYKIDGLYHDFSWPIFCRNTKHGCPAEGGYPILAMRELYRRTQTILKSQPRPTFEVAHTGYALVCAPICSFMDATLNGEEVYLPRGNGNYYKALYSSDPRVAASFDGFIADYIGRQFGTIPNFCQGSLYGTDYMKPQYERRILSIMLLHEVLTGWGSWREEYTKMWKVLNDFGIDDAEFIPYWNKQQPVTVSSFDPKPAEYSLSAPVVISVYNCSGKKALIVVANTSEVKIHTAINIDSKTLGFTKPIRVRDAYNPDMDLLKSNNVEVDIPELESRLLLVDLVD
jgi:hypothetical protein